MPEEAVVNVTDSRISRLEDAGFKAFKAAERQKAETHAATVKAALTQSRKAAQHRK